MYYLIRITLDEATKEQVETYIKTFKVYAYAFETGKETEKPHYHILIDTDLKDRTLRSQLVKLAGKGNGRYSCKKNTVDGFPLAYLHYVSKEGSMQTQGIPEDIIEKAKTIKIKDRAKEPFWRQVMEELEKNEYQFMDYTVLLNDIKLVYLSKNVLITRNQVESIALHYIAKHHGQAWLKFFNNPFK